MIQTSIYKACTENIFYKCDALNCFFWPLAACSTLPALQLHIYILQNARIFSTHTALVQPCSRVRRACNNFTNSQNELMLVINVSSWSLDCALECAALCSEYEFSEKELQMKIKNVVCRYIWKSFSYLATPQCVEYKATNYTLFVYFLFWCILSMDACVCVLR